MATKEGQSMKLSVIILSQITSEIEMDEPYTSTQGHIETFQYTNFDLITYLVKIYKIVKPKDKKL